MGSKSSGGVTSSHGGTCKAFPGSPTQLQAWEGSAEVGGVSLANNEGLPLGHVQKHAPPVGDVDYGWWSTGVAWWDSAPPSPYDLHFQTPKT